VECFNGVTTESILDNIKTQKRKVMENYSGLMADTIRVIGAKENNMEKAVLELSMES
jgi:hypothetical protein